jgi:hypothetical protein
MNSAFEYITLAQREREAQIESDRLARFVARVRACCDPSLFVRLAHALRGTPAAC